MKTVALFASLALAATAATAPAQAGCLTGAVVGGVGAHYALHGKHTVAGAIAGCAVGHHMAVMKKKKIAEQKKEAAMAAQGQPVPAHH